MSNHTIIFRTSQDFHDHIHKCAMEEETPVSAYIRKIVKQHTKYDKHTLLETKPKKDTRNPFVEEEDNIPPLDELDLD